MLVKGPDDKGGAIRSLRHLLSGDLSDRARRRVQKEIDDIVEGERGERDAAFHLDSMLGPSGEFAVVHDLCIEHDGVHAQIDHLVVTRRRQVFVIETKAINGTLRIDGDGACTAVYESGRRFRMPSPVEQSRRHAAIMRAWLGAMGSTMREVVPVVAVSPRTRVSVDLTADDVAIVPTDRLPEWIRRRERLDDHRFVVTGNATASMEEIAGAAWLMSRAHAPRQVDWAARTGVSPASRPDGDLLGDMGPSPANAPATAAELYIDARSRRDDEESKRARIRIVDVHQATLAAYDFPDGRGAIKWRDGHDRRRFERVARAHGGYRHRQGYWVLPAGRLDEVVKTLAAPDPVQPDMFDGIDITLAPEAGRAPAAIHSKAGDLVDAPASRAGRPAEGITTVATPHGEVTLRTRSDGCRLLSHHAGNLALAGHVRAVCAGRASRDPSSGLWILPSDAADAIVAALPLPAVRMAS